MLRQRDGTLNRYLSSISGGRFVRTARRYRTITIKAGNHTLTAAHPLPDELRVALAAIADATASKLIQVGSTSQFGKYEPRRNLGIARSILPARVAN